MKNLYRYQNKV